MIFVYNQRLVFITGGWECIDIINQHKMYLGIKQVRTDSYITIYKGKMQNGKPVLFTDPIWYDNYYFDWIDDPLVTIIGVKRRLVV
jgi:hypothetical protein